jgi:hypothetical protein
MAFKVQWGEDGLPFALCDTATETVELLKLGRLGPFPAQTNGAKAPQPHHEAPAPIFSTEEKVASVFGMISDNGKQLLKELLGHPQGISAEDLAEAIGVSSSGIGGRLGSISKAAQKYQLEIGQFVQSETREEGDVVVRWLTPNKLLVEHRNRL